MLVGCQRFKGCFRRCHGCSSEDSQDPHRAKRFRQCFFPPASSWDARDSGDAPGDARDAPTRIPRTRIGPKASVDVSPPGSSWDVKDSGDAPEDAKDALTRIPGMGIGSKGVVDVSPPGSSWDIKDSRDAPEDARDAPEDASDALTRVQGSKGFVDVSLPASSWDARDSADAPEDARDAGCVGAVFERFRFFCFLTPLAVAQRDSIRSCNHGR